MRRLVKNISIALFLCTASIAYSQNPVQFDTDFNLNGHQLISSSSEDDVVTPFRINLLTDGQAPTLLQLGRIGSIVEINSAARELMIGYHTTLTSPNPDLRIYGGNYFINHIGTSDRIGVRTQVLGKGGDKYGFYGHVADEGVNNYGIYAIAQNGENNYGIAAYASGGNLNYAGFFGGDVKVEGDVTATTFEGDGSKLTNLPADDDWLTNGDVIYNQNDKVVIGKVTGEHQLTIANGTGQLITLNEANKVNIPLTLQIFDNGVGPSGANSGTIGSLVDINVSETDEITGYKSLVRSQASNTKLRGAEFIAQSNATTNRTGVSARAFGDGGDKQGVSAISLGVGVQNTGLSGFAQGATTNIGVYGFAAGGTVNYAGQFVGDVSTSGRTETKSLVVGDTTNTTFSSMQGGTFVLGYDNGPNDSNDAIGFAEITITFPNPFPSVPVLILTPSAQDGTDFDDSFSVTTKNVTTTGATLNVYRLDATEVWGQQLELDWFGFSN